MLTSISKRNKQTTASTAELDTDVETSAPLHLCHQNRTATKHLELFYSKQTNKQQNGEKKGKLLVFCKDFQIYPGN